MDREGFSPEELAPFDEFIAWLEGNNVKEVDFEY
jgi:hypothetical protein